MTRQTVEQVVPAEPGAYVLGTNQNRALYVARADNLRAKLLTHFGAPGPNTVHIHQFWFQPTADAAEAYRLECTWYHRFSPTHNAVHPTRPPGLMPCPICGR